jgi:hypothetical protein
MFDLKLNSLVSFLINRLILYYLKILLHEKIISPDLSVFIDD